VYRSNICVSCPELRLSGVVVLADHTGTNYAALQRNLPKGGGEERIPIVDQEPQPGGRWTKSGWVRIALTNR